MGTQRTARGLRNTALLLVATVGLVAACHRQVKSAPASPPTHAQLAELWHAPEPGRDLLHGVGGKPLAPDPSVRYTVIEIKRTGFSRGYTVVDPKGNEWSAKFPPEAPTEVVASRIHWGIGYHQPPIYYLADWNAAKATSPNPQLPARFRQKKPDLHGLEDVGEWSLYDNPFLGTRELAGLIVLQVMLANSDLKDANTALYTLKAPLEGASRWYVLRDVGHTFGGTGVAHAPRGDVRVFEESPFIKGVVDGKVEFHFHGRHGGLVENITTADVRWICSQLQKLTDEQWDAAFRSGGYAKETADRFIRRMKQKIAEGLALQD